MKPQTPEYLRELLAEQQPPCVSIYMPTARARPPANENPVRLGNLVRDAVDQMGRKYRHAIVDGVLKNLNGLVNSTDLFLHPTDGLAIFASPSTFRVLKLQRTVKESAEVGSSFHVKPLIRASQVGGRFQILCLRLGMVRIHEGNESGIEELPRRNLPRNINEALNRKPPTQPDEPNFNRISGTEDRERFMRVVDRAVWENYSRQLGLPLIFCAVEEYHHVFHKISQNPYLMDEGIKLDPESIDTRRLHAEATKILKPYGQQQVQRLIEEYQYAHAHGRASDDLKQVAEAMVVARVGTLLIDADKQIAGRLNAQTGQVEFGSIEQPDYQDVLDDIAEQTIRTGGQVLVLPTDQMPTNTGVAAIYRF